MLKRLLLFVAVYLMMGVSHVLMGQSKSIILSDTERQWLQDHPVIRVSNELDWPPFDFMKDGFPAGFSIDYVNLVAEKVGLKVDWVNGYTWEQLTSLFKEKKIDLLQSVAQTPKRSLFMSFTKPYAESGTAVFMRKGVTRVGSVNELRGKKVAVVRGFMVEEELERNYPDITIIRKSTSLETLQSVATGESDAALLMQAVGEYLIKKNFIVNLHAVAATNRREFPVSPMRLAAQKQHPELISILEKGMDAVSNKEYDEITRKWVFNENTRQVKLSHKEKVWLAAHSEITLGTDETWAPNVVRKGDGSLAGIDVDYLDYIKKVTGLSIKIKIGSWADIVEDAEAGRIDGLMDSAVIDSRRKHFLFSKPYLTEYPILLVRMGDSIKVDAPEDLNGKQIFYQKGNAFNKKVLDSLTGIRAVGAESELKAVKLVVEGKGDACIISSQIYGTYAKSFAKVVAIGWWFDDHPLELVYSIRKDWPELVSIINKALNEMPQERKNNIIKKWSGLTREEFFRPANILTSQEQKWLKAHKQIRLGVDPLWPPFEFLELGENYRGIAADFVRTINDDLDIEMKHVSGLTWAQVIEKAKAGEIDVLPCVVKTPERMEYLNFTEPYVERPLVILSEEDSPLYEDIDEIMGTIAVIEGYYAEELLQRDYPHKKFLTIKTLEEAIRAVSRGKADAFVGNVTSINYNIRRLGIDNVKISGYSEYRFELHLAVRKDWPELVTILNKQLASIPKTEKRQIISSWTNYRVEREVDWLFLTLWAGGVTIIAGGVVSFFVYTNSRLTKEVVERKKAEEIADEANAQLTKAKESAEAANMAKSEFLAIMSHEIRTPMNAVIGFSEILAETELSFQQQTYVKNIRTGGRLLLNLINDILDLSKIEAGKMELQHSLVNPHDLFYEMELIFSNKINEKGLELIIEIGDNVPKMLILDEGRLRQILVNLIGNAIKFTRSGHIKLSVSSVFYGEIRSHLDLVFSVADTGIGIPKDQQEKIFKAFEQVKGQIND